MKQVSVSNKRYDFLGRLAIIMQTQNMQISFETANRMLAENGLKPYKQMRGLASGISAAYRAWERAENKASISNPYSRAIASVYTNQYGHLAWM